MQITLDLGRWTKLHSALVIVAALVVGGVVDRAVAVSPTVPAPIKWSGGVPAVFGTAASGTDIPLYTVPTGQNFMLTDLILSNPSAYRQIQIFSATANDCGGVGAHINLADVFVPGSSTPVISLVTGIVFTAGQRVCLRATGIDIDANARGFLFTAASPSQDSKYPPAARPAIVGRDRFSLMIV